VLSPPLGAIADAAGRRKPWLFGFTMLCIVGSAGLWFAYPSQDAILLAIACVIIANLGFEFGVVFNNAMLPDIAAQDALGRLSGWAWALGYAGGLVALVLALVVLILPPSPPFGLDKAAGEPIRLLGPLIAIWFAAFAWPLFVFTPDRPATPGGVGLALRNGLRRLMDLRSELRDDPAILRFLVAHMLYADGLATLFAFGGIYAAGTFGMTLMEVAAFGILLNVTAGLGAFGFGWVDDLIGSRRTVIVALTALLAASILALMAETRTMLWIAGAAIGLFVGPVQAASRSFMVRLSPAARQAEYFGLYALSGRATTFVGPAVVALVTSHTQGQRPGLFVIVVLFLAGLLLLLSVPDRHAPATVG